MASPLFIFSIRTGAPVSPTEARVFHSLAPVRKAPASILYKYCTVVPSVAMSENFGTGFVPWAKPNMLTRNVALRSKSLFFIGL